FMTHDITDPIVRDINLEDLNNHAVPIVPLEDINERAKIAENFYAHEEKLLNYIREGNEEKAFAEAKFFTRSNMTQRIPNRLLSHRSLVYSANTLYRKAAQSVGIHPIYLDEISQGFAKRLAICTTHQQIDAIYHDMIVDYCALCRTHSTQQYSPNMRTIINYISLNLSEDINLNSIAEAVNFSPSYISRKFKEEVGTTLPKYIAEQRIELAKSLLEKTGMSVKEVSYYIGIPDWNYFTKLFKKSVGVTPSEYKKNI
ncbi:MAG: AraC family transcriptional regulator, partial [Lachnospira sp.]|nr:AraC family transcriptional regulator [Lachnospira sp.]